MSVQFCHSVVEETPLTSFFSFFPGSRLMNTSSESQQANRLFLVLLPACPTFYQGHSHQLACFEWPKCIFWSPLAYAGVHSCFKSWLFGHCCVWFSFLLPDVTHEGLGLGWWSVRDSSTGVCWRKQRYSASKCPCSFFCFVLLLLKNKWTPGLLEYLGTRCCHWFSDYWNLELEFLIINLCILSFMPKRAYLGDKRFF